ncbi:SLC13 family permease [Lactobacillus sp. YT155]|uniref:SLC13 family permease n=1 Tax=Lactobacillus sp. YT155 TaxID=3060955 RepID=UPI00265E74B4|nr:SLC13 family permease [Lactobacillus sp. YT155]MDO1605710.1 SLC13 family permease [Lactobacillus sp. YT155]
MAVIFKKIASDKVLLIAFVAAIITSFLSAPHIIQDINWHMIGSLLSMMLLVQVYEYLDFLEYIATELSIKAKTVRQLMVVIVCLSFFGAMVLTNDITILTMIPLFHKMAKHLKINPVMPVILIAVSSNLGSIFTPFGNAHNLYVLSHYNLSITQFFKMSAPISIISFVVLLLLTMTFPKQEIQARELKKIVLNKPALAITFAITILFFLSIFSFIPIWIPLIFSIVWTLLLNYHVTEAVDYALLLTFMCFGVAVGNASRIPEVVQLFKFLEKDPMSIYLTSLITSQFMSNVPTTILVSQFTKDVTAVFLGTNLAGIGTVISSMANLLTFKQYNFFFKVKPLRFLVTFFVVDLLLLILFGVIGAFLIYI